MLVFNSEHAYSLHSHYYVCHEKRCVTTLITPAMETEQHANCQQISFFCTHDLGKLPPQLEEKLQEIRKRLLLTFFALPHCCVVACEYSRLSFAPGLNPGNEVGKYQTRKVKLNDSCCCLKCPIR